MAAVFGFVEFYVSPLFVAIGLAFLLSGLVNYFIIGNLGFEEERREVGRQSLLWAALFFIIALIVYAISSWLVDFSQRIDVDGDAGVERGGDVLRVPNVPGVQ